MGCRGCSGSVRYNPNQGVTSVGGGRWRIPRPTVRPPASPTVPAPVSPPQQPVPNKGS